MLGRPQLLIEVSELVRLILLTTRDPRDPEMAFARRCLLRCLERRLNRLSRRPTQRCRLEAT